jgi:16S rRNA processing protein RimM
MQAENERVVVGRIAGVYGLGGWVKIISYTRPRENIFTYTPWQVRQSKHWVNMDLQTGRRHGKGLIASLQNVDDRESARALINADIAISRIQMPKLPEGEYYWCDLVGLSVENQAGIELGKVIEIVETGANDVLVIEGKKRILIPLLMGNHVHGVDLELGKIQVAWQPEN